MTLHITVCSPKGGTGKTTLVENLLVLFERAGKNVLGVDFDPQQTLLKWHARRQENASASQFDCAEASLTDWRNVLAHAAHYDVAIFDVPPGMDSEIMSVSSLCQKSDLVLVPSAMKIADIDSVGPWVAELDSQNIPNALVMNHANPREKFFKEARAEMNKIGTLCPIEIRSLADAHQHTIDGLTASDKPKCSSASDFQQVYDFVCKWLKSHKK
ncbi:ParA family protein [Saccharibacter floricola]|uniref:ParA-like protein n=1 Tax=Saccharibacter floricola DSM 15669 TaxID=1123227 RepID=A0ABQ0P0A7_9PROT|nr:ParA family protein [Saccharibacter floricola]GBQ08066.1 ParA-like protein [Saccharibacter floricola DSM 15669]